jgi:hypothetical protein
MCQSEEFNEVRDQWQTFLKQMCTHQYLFMYFSLPCSKGGCNHFLFESMNHFRWPCETSAALCMQME